MLVKYSFRIGEHETTISMEQEFWDALRDLAADRDTTLPALLKEIVAETGTAAVIERCRTGQQRGRFSSEEVWCAGASGSREPPWSA